MFGKRHKKYVMYVNVSDMPAPAAQRYLEKIKEMVSSQEDPLPSNVWELLFGKRPEHWIYVPVRSGENRIEVL